MLSGSRRTERSRMDDTWGTKPQAQVWGKTQTGVMGKEGAPGRTGSRKFRERTWDSYHCGRPVLEMEI